MNIDILRSFAEARAGDDEIVPGITYRVARDLLIHIDGLTVHRNRLRSRHSLLRKSIELLIDCDDVGLAIKAYLREALKEVEE